MLITNCMKLYLSKIKNITGLNSVKTTTIIYILTIHSNRFSALVCHSVSPQAREESLKSPARQTVKKLSQSYKTELYMYI